MSEMIACGCYFPSPFLIFQNQILQISIHKGNNRRTNFLQFTEMKFISCLLGICCIPIIVDYVKMCRFLQLAFSEVYPTLQLGIPTSKEPYQYTIKAGSPASATANITNRTNRGVDLRTGSIELNKHYPSIYGSGS